MRGSVSPLTAVVAGLGAAVAGWIGYSALLVDHHASLPPAIDAERKQFLSRESGLLNYYADTRAPGTPLVLIHSINAAASSYEMRPLFNHFRAERPVYALDLPGFGFSERSDRPYSPGLYANAILDFMTTQVRQPADVVALSLSSEFVARAAVQLPGLFSTISMISPSGFTERPPAVSSQGARRSQASDIVYSLFSFPLWSQAFYDLLATPASIRYFLQKSFIGPVFPALADYAYASAHQPGGRYAPLYFVSGKLFTPDVRETLYASLKMPVLVIYDRDPYVTFDALEPFIQTRANWYTSRIVPSRGLPQFEHLLETAQALVDFWTAQEPLRPVETTRLSGWNAQDSRD
ncbi:MAG: alpha/beta hydrolase [Anaerolineae bacterium]|nr:alpha/beta hydrolase [Anaerolineae bacterium]